MPASVYGAVRQGINIKDTKSAQEWQNYFAEATTRGNAAHLNVLALFAYAYQSRWSRHYHKTELLDRITRGMDCYCIMQGIDGGFTNKTWVGAPQRQPARGSPLEGFGTQAFGRSVVLVFDELQASGLLKEPMDHDFDTGTPLMPRRQAWAEMLRKHVDFLIGKRGHATNQDLAQLTSLCLANEAAYRLYRKQALPPAQIKPYVYSAVGLANDPLGGYWFSRKGMCLEPWGTLAGGYDGHYGLMGVHMLTSLAEIVPHKVVIQRLVDAVDSAAYFYYPDVDEDGFACMRKETFISTRNTKWPATRDYGTDYPVAGALKNQRALRAFQLALDHGVMPLEIPDWRSPHYVDELKELMHDAFYVDRILAQLPVKEPLPMEAGHPDFAWADEQGSTVVVKHNGARMYLSLNWRRGFQDDKRDPQHVRVNNIARVHFTTPTVDRIATFAMESPYGFGKLYLCRYGDYYVGMNLTDDQEFEMPVPAGQAAALDLITGKSIALSPAPRVPPSQTLVFYLGQPRTETSRGNSLMGRPTVR